MAIYNRTRSRGEQFAGKFHVPAYYHDPEELPRREKLDFVDIVTYPFNLSHFVKLVAAHKIPVISQTPMAPSVAIAEENIKACREAGVPYFIHENWRWQTQLRELKKTLKLVFAAYDSARSGNAVRMDRARPSAGENPLQAVKAS